MKDYRDIMNPNVRGWPSVNESIKNKKYSQAYILLNNLLEHIGYEPFTIRDLQEVLNPLTKKGTYLSKSVGWGESHLQTLVDEGILTFDEQTKEYEIDPTSQRLIEFCESYQSLE